MFASALARMHAFHGRLKRNFRHWKRSSQQVMCKQGADKEAEMQAAFIVEWDAGNRMLPRGDCTELFFEQQAVSDT
jgi:hypothetical protein